MGDRAQGAEVRDQTVGGRSTARPDTEDPRLSIELLEDVPQRAVPAPGARDDRRQVLAAEAIRFAGGEGVDVGRRSEIGDRPEECEEAANLGAGIQP